MLEDPDAIRAKIKHYEYLLTLYSTKYAKEDVRKLIADAQAQLSVAVAEASRSTTDDHRAREPGGSL
jgi:hypothetical protein